MSDIILRVELTISAKEGVTEGYNSEFGGRTFESSSGTQTAHPRELIDLIHGVLEETTRSDDTNLWYVSKTQLGMWNK